MKAVIDQIRRSIRFMQRDDYAIANNSIGLDQLKSEVSVGLNPPTVWATATNYVASDTVFAGLLLYACVTSHVSGVFATDLAAGKWSLLADFTGAQSAALVSYSNATSNLAATTVQTAIDEMVTHHVAKSVGSYTAVAADNNRFWRCTGAVTVNLTAAATLKDGWCLWVRANGGTVTIDPAGAELIDGAATLVLADGQTARILCTGTAFFSVAGGTAGGVAVSGPASATDNAIPRFDGATGKLLQNSGIIVDDSNNVSGMGTLALSGNVTRNDGTVTVVGPYANAGICYYGTVTNHPVNILLNNGVVAQFTATGLNGTAIGASAAAAASVTTFAASGAAHMGATVRFGQNTQDSPGNGNNTAGAGITSHGVGNFSAEGSALFANRTSDGAVVTISASGVGQGVISVSGSTTTYGTFFGSHWSQLLDGSKSDILRGTIVESLDEMCSWPAFR